MIQKETRKRFSVAGIASMIHGAVVGASAPASAAGTDYFTMGAAYGTSTNLVAVQGTSYGITLETSFVTVPSGLDKTALAYQIEIVTDGYKAGATGTGTQVSFNSYATVSATTPTSAIKAAHTENANHAFTQSATNTLQAHVKPTGSAAILTSLNNFLQLETTTTYSDDIDVKIRAWLDNDGDGVVDGNELAVSDWYTVTFVTPENLAPAVSFQSTVIGQTSVTASMTLGSVNPYNYFKHNANAPYLVFTNAIDADGEVSSSAGVGTASAAVAWDAVNGVLEASINGSGLTNAQSTSGVTTVSDAALYAVLYFDGDYDGDNAAVPASFNASTAAFPVYGSLDLAAKSVARATLSAVASSAVSQDATRQGGSNIVDVLEGTKTIAFKIAMTDSSGDPVSNGVVTTVTLNDGSGDGLDTTTITSNGKTLKHTGVNAVSFNLTTNIAGEVEFEVAADKAVAGETFTVQASAEGESTNTLTVQWEKEALTAYGPSNTTIAPGDTFVANFIVVNQFGSVVAGDYQLKVTRARTSGTRTDALGTTANWAYVAPVVNGAAQVTIVDNGGAASGVDTVTATVQKKATAGGAYVDVATATNDTFTLTYNTSLTGAALTAKVNNNGVKAGSTTVQPIALEAETLVAYDSRTSADAPDYAASNAYASATATRSTALVTITGTLKTSTGANITGVPVTVAGSGLVFGVGSDYYLNEASVVTSAGAYSVTVRGGLSGKQTVTITALGKTETIELTFAAGSVAASNMVVTAPATSDAGKVIDVVVKVTDANGNAASDVAVSFKSTGPGYLNALSGTTDADGEVIVKLITLTNDSGTATITATATLAGVSTAKVATVTVGAAAASADQKVNAGSFKGYVALYAKGYAGKRMSAKVGKDWVVVPVLASNFERVVEFTGAGYTISVPIYIDRVLVDTIVVTTK